MKPFSDNIIFLDAEFSGLDPATDELLSVGMVKLNGEELYFELEYQGAVNDFAKEHILPLLTAPKMDKSEVIEIIKNFVGERKPYMISYVNQYDAIYLYKLFGLGNDGRPLVPFYWLPLDFASMLFAWGRDPANFVGEEKDSLIKELGIDISKYREHHALDDAKILREVYLKLVSC